jgi:hypothetical protein
MQIAPWIVPVSALQQGGDSTERSVDADAPELGFPPGKYPAYVKVVPKVGNGEVFEFERFDGNQTAHYRQPGISGLALHVWND